MVEHMESEHKDCLSLPVACQTCGISSNNYRLHLDHIKVAVSTSTPQALPSNCHIGRVDKVICRGCLVLKSFLKGRQMKLQWPGWKINRIYFAEVSYRSFPAFITSLSWHSCKLKFYHEQGCGSGLILTRSGFNLSGQTGSGSMIF